MFLGFLIFLKNIQKVQFLKWFKEKNICEGRRNKGGKERKRLKGKGMASRGKHKWFENKVIYTTIFVVADMKEGNYKIKLSLLVVTTEE